jgi:hypothetical protein
MTRTRPLLGLLAALLTLAGACTAAFTRPWNLPFVDGMKDRSRMSHAAHAEMGLACTTCHDAVEESHVLRGLAPKKATCAQCHQDWVDAGDCKVCHTDPTRTYARPDPAPHLRMSHAAHLPRVDGDCARCHAVLPEPGRRAPDPVPMATCNGCHEHKRWFESGRCDDCHVDLVSRPLRPVSFYAHEGNFVRGHREVARTHADSCTTCHQGSFCVDCHSTNTAALPVERLRPDNVGAPYVHRNDFLTRHGLESRADPASCLRCHQTSSCNACHTANNVTSQGRHPRRPHPPGYARPGNEPFHGTEARAGITRCAACHDQGGQSICVKCHQSGGVGGSPHPVDWSATHTREEIRTHAMCLYCHR